MKTVHIRNYTIGQGQPIICAAITGNTLPQIMAQAEKIKERCISMIEWRMDCFEQVEDEQAVNQCLSNLRSLFNQEIILATYRTEYEGGHRPITMKSYVALNQQVAHSGYVDLVDVEVSRQHIDIDSLIGFCHKAGVYVVGSFHDFNKTPDVQDIIKIFGKMDKAKADILKIAVMPVCQQDVLTLLQATLEGKEFNKPLITMSMGQLGVISRLGGGIFGSAVTFASVCKASAPGQVDSHIMKQVMNVIYETTGIEKFKRCLQNEEGFPRNIFLTGFMGTGKSALSRKMAEMLPLKEFDMDSRIVENQGMSINDIFEKQGEAYFRQLETKLLIELQKEKHLLVSCGGGVVLREENVVEMKKNGIVVLLTASADTILQRVRYNDDRPLLRGNKNIEFIEGMLSERGPKYKAAADITIVTDGKAVDEIAEEVCTKLLEYK